MNLVIVNIENRDPQLQQTAKIQLLWEFLSNLGLPGIMEFTVQSHNLTISVTMMCTILYWVQDIKRLACSTMQIQSNPNGS